MGVIRDVSCRSSPRNRYALAHGSIKIFLFIFLSAFHFEDTGCLRREKAFDIWIIRRFWDIGNIDYHCFFITLENNYL